MGSLDRTCLASPGTVSSKEIEEVGQFVTGRGRRREQRRMGRRLVFFRWWS